MMREAILLPVFAQVGLTLFLMFWMGWVRVGLISRGEVAGKDIALGQKAWPTRPTQIANAYHNQFQLPVLFYVLAGLTIIMGKADLIQVILAWFFVALRIFHAWVHTGSNALRLRFYGFVAGALVLLAMWLVFAIEIVAGA